MRIGAMVLAAVIALPVPGLASKPMQPGEPYFGLYMHTDGTPRPGEVFPLLVRAGSSQHGSNCIGDVRIHVPTGFQVVRGDVARKVHVSNRWTGSPDNEWILFLRAAKVGQFTVQGSIKISCGDPASWDESETLVDLDVRSDTTVVRGGYATKFERVRGGKRFRYGGARVIHDDRLNASVIRPGHMVLIDGSEQIVSGDVSDHPTSIGKVTSSCAECGLQAARTLHFSVTVGRNGAVTWIDSTPSGESEPVLAAARRALESSRFRPAHTKNGQIVADWTDVEVIVEP